MTSPSFVDWLSTQECRADSVGMLAMSVLHDPDAAQVAVTVADVKRRMRAVRASRRYWFALGVAAAEYQAAMDRQVAALAGQSKRLH